MKKEKSYGFGVVEIVIVVAVAGLLAGIGWYVWQGQNSKLTSDKNDTKQVDDYAGWKSYCDDSRKVCFQYPADWVVEVNEITGSTSVSLHNPDKTVYGTYNSEDTRDGAEAPYIAEAMGDLATRNEKYKFIGGYVVSQATLPQYKVVDSSMLTKWPLEVGKQGIFLNTARFTQHSNTSYGSFAVNPANNNFTSQQAKTWLGSEDGKVARLIVKSFQIKD